MTAPCEDATPESARALLDAGIVYRPQHDSYLLVEAVRSSGLARSATAADLCTGSGVIAREVALMGARSVVGVDSCPDAVRVARSMCAQAPGRVSMEHSDIAGLLGRDRFDLVTCNPPYVPTPADGSIRERKSPRNAWEAGVDGRAVLDILCAAAHRLLNPGGSLFVVQSEFADIDASIRTLETTGLDARVVLSRSIPFGPVLTAHAGWLRETGRLAPGQQTERLAVIRADNPRAAAPREVTR
ncbi:methyltransferase [Gordonia sp. SID5947]|uniref:methyltransferase n=1 Tax=Gordonia sp. SID5947 TaxID=2690315 RepID=UPI00136914E6|nr:methyltransferase [Gordonia sp. SID5947]MYR08194.1 methyltransferase [Gordonia sp. SID5947]